MMDVEKQRVNLMLDSDVVALLDDLSGSERKRGMFISNLIRVTHAAQSANADLRSMDVEALRLTVLGLNGRVQSVEGEITRLSSQLAATIAKMG